MTSPKRNPVTWWDDDGDVVVVVARPNWDTVGSSFPSSLNDGKEGGRTGNSDPCGPQAIDAVDGDDNDILSWPSMVCPK